MKLALFFFLSFVVHAAVFLIPVALNGRAPERAIVVAILPMESASEPSANAGAKKFAAATSIKRTSGAAPSSTPIALAPYTIEAPSVAAENILVSITGLSVAGVSHNNGETSTSGVGAGGGNLVAGRTATGLGNGEGSGAGQAGATLTQARYRETPQPHYPDSARRAGKEGRVLLRVLVDEEGRAKAVEVNTSSGHDMLDQAASEALKKWRFVPAHAAGKPIETWVKVPIEFQLSNSNR